MSGEPQMADKTGEESEPQGQLPERRRETHARLVASFLATNPGAKFALPAAAHAGAANATSGAWTVQQHDQAKGVYVDQLTTDNVVEVHEMFKCGSDFRVLDNALHDIAADYDNGRPIYHGRSLFHTELQRKLQVNVDGLLDSPEALASALLRAARAIDSTVDDADTRRRTRFVVDGAVYPDDSDGPVFQADGQHAPFVVFDVDRQENLPGTYDTRGAAEAALVAHVVQEAVMTLAAAELTIAKRPAAPMNLQASDGAAQILGDSAQATNDEDVPGGMQP